MRKPCRLILGLAVLFSLGGCNKLKLGYEYADWLILYAVDDNFDLGKAQRARVKRDVAGYLAWHRKALLPQYADLLARVADSMKAGMRPEGVDSGYMAYQALYRKTMEPVVDPAVNLLLSLARSQVDAWSERQRRKIKKLRKDYSGNEDEKLERRYERTVNELQDWTGRLSADQKKQIREWSRALPWNGDLWLEKREKVQADLAALLRRKAPRAEVRAFVENYFLHPERQRSAAYNERFRANMLMTRDLVVKIHGILTPEQRSRFISEIENLAGNLRSMSRAE